MKKIKVLSLLAALVLTCTSCAALSTENINEATQYASSSALETELFSDRDYDTSYDEEEAVIVELDDETVTIDEEGTYLLSGTILDGSVIIDAPDDAKIQLILDGCNITSSSSAAIYVKNADKVFITTSENSVNTLTNTSGFEADGDTNVDGVIFSKADLTLNGKGTLIIDSVQNGIVSKDELVITSGTYEITSEGHGLQGKDDIAIFDGYFTITAGEDAIHGKNSDDPSLGYVVIEGGEFTIDSGDDAIHAESDLVINGGNIDILRCAEGLEGNTVTVTQGTVSIIASDDAVNAAGSAGDTMTADSTCFVKIEGGTLDITTDGDGIDSNGDLIITGGYITISGPENSGNGSLDYAGTGSITGGTIIAAGMAGMEMNMSEATQGSILVSTGNQTSGTAITVTDGTGEEILIFTPSTTYSSVLISSPELEVGQTYTVSCGSYSESITLEDYISGQTMGMGGRIPDGENMPFEAPEGGFEGGVPGDHRGPGARGGFEEGMPPPFPSN